MAWKRIADRIMMGTWTHVANRIYHRENQACVNTQDPFTFTLVGELVIGATAAKFMKVCSARR